MRLTINIYKDYLKVRMCSDHLSSMSLAAVLVKVVCIDFLAAYWKRLCSNCTFLANLLLCTFGSKND